MGQRSLILAAILASSVLVFVASHPVATPSQVDGQEKNNAAYVEKLETDLVQAAALGEIAEAIRIEQSFEEQILKTAVKTLMRDRADPKKQARDMQALNELVKRDKRAVELLTGVLGSSSGSTGSENGSTDAGGGSNALSLVTGVLGSSSGGGGDSEGGGGGSSILSLVPSLLGSSSGGGGDSEDGGGGSNLLSLIPSVLGSSSGGGGDDAGGDGGGGSNILSLLTGILGSSSGSNSGDAGASTGSFKPLGGIFDQKLNLLNVGGGDEVLKGGTYDDLIGKGGGGDLIGTITNTVASVLKTKFNVFKSLFSSLTGNLLGGSGSGGATT